MAREFACGNTGQNKSGPKSQAAIAEKTTMEENSIKSKALARFATYIKNYDLKDPKIALKAGHTYRVADFCERIARSEGMTEEDILIAWFCGLLHDIGRFEQVTRYGTFMDSQSVDHAHLSCWILFGNNMTDDGSMNFSDEKESENYNSDPIIREFIDNDEYDRLIMTAIWWHSAYRYPETLTNREKIFCDILRDADKVDIFRVNTETPLSDVHNLPMEEFYTSDVTPEVFEAFQNHICVLRSLRQTAVDNIIGYCSLYWELVYPESRRIAWNQGCLMQLASFETRNPHAGKIFEQIREEFRAEERAVADSSL